MRLVLFLAVTVVSAAALAGAAFAQQAGQGRGPGPGAQGSGQQMQRGQMQGGRMGGGGPMGGQGRMTIPGPNMQARIAQLDADSDGRVSLAELLEWRGLVFEAMDADSDGAVTREEFMALQMGRGADPADRGPRYEAMQAAKAAEFEAMDPDGTGAVGLDAFMAHAEAVFREADANGDGVLDPAEFAAMHRR